MVSCKLKNKNMATNPNDIVKIEIEDPPVPQEDPVPRETEEDPEISLTPFEKMVQTMYDRLRSAFNLDPTGEFRGVAVVVTLDRGKTWTIEADSTESQKYGGMEIWSKAYVEAEVTKIKTAFPKNPAGKGNDEQLEQDKKELDNSPV